MTYTLDDGDTLSSRFLADWNPVKNLSLKYDLSWEGKGLFLLSSVLNDENYSYGDDVEIKNNVTDTNNNPVENAVVNVKVINPNFNITDDVDINSDAQGDANMIKTMDVRGRWTALCSLKEDFERVMQENWEVTLNTSFIISEGWEQ